MKCPECKTGDIYCMNNDLKDYKGDNYSHECLNCGKFFTREDYEKLYKNKKQVLME